MKARVKERRSLSQWHPWFAWYPVRVYAGTSALYTWVWLERIERKIKFGYASDDVFYRLLPENRVDQSGSKAGGDIVGRDKR